MLGIIIEMTIPRLTQSRISSQKIPSKWQDSFYSLKGLICLGKDAGSWLSKSSCPSFIILLSGSREMHVQSNAKYTYTFYSYEIPTWPLVSWLAQGQNSSSSGWNQEEGMKPKHAKRSPSPSHSGPQMLRKGKSRKSTCKRKGKVRGFLYGLPSVKGVDVRVESLYFLPFPVTLFSVQQQLLFSLYKTRAECMN